MVDHWLGGKDHYTTDHLLCREIDTLYPGWPTVVRDLYRTMHDVAAVLGRAGITQFVTVEWGYPAHLPRFGSGFISGEISTRVMHLSDDPILLAHLRALCASHDTVVLPGALSDLPALQTHPAARHHLNHDEPIAVLAPTALHHVAPGRSAQALKAAADDGLILVLGHLDGDPVIGTPERRALELLRSQVGEVMTWTTDAIGELFAGHPLRPVPIASGDPSPLRVWAINQP